MAVLNYDGSHLFGLDNNTIQTIVENADKISGISEILSFFIWKTFNNAS